MFLFPRICPVCTREFEGGNHVHCPACEEADDMRTALMELKRDVDQLKAPHVSYVNFACSSEKKPASTPQLKPLFVPLKTEYFELFKLGKKHEEIRVYGARWNERTCSIGRPVVLSKGYGKSERLRGTITSFTIHQGLKLKRAERATVLKLYGCINVYFAFIGMSINAEQRGAHCER